MTRFRNFREFLRLESAGALALGLFIGTLAFDDPPRDAEVRGGVLLGSIFSAVVGYAVLRATARER